MKLELEIPDWAQERDIYVLAGIEVIAAIPFNSGKLFVKTVRCNECGECCKSLPRKAPFPIEIDNSGKCNHLVKYGDRYECTLGARRPWACCTGEPNLNRETRPYCCIRFEAGEI